METTAHTTSLVKEITIDAPIERVFDALTDREQRLIWWDDAEHKVESIESDLRVGGKWSMLSVSPRRHRVYGEYRVIDRPHVFEFTWRNDWYDDFPDTVVRFELTDLGGKTHLRLTHSGFVNAEIHRDHEQGWTTVLGWLNRYIEARK